MCGLPFYFIDGNICYLQRICSLQLADSTIYARRTKLAELAILKSIRIYDFRNSCASLLVNKGANVQVVAKYLEHTKIEKTLNTYSHMFSTAFDSIVSVIDSLEDN